MRLISNFAADVLRRSSAIYKSTTNSRPFGKRFYRFILGFPQFEMLKMWKTFCRKIAKNPVFSSIKVGLNQSFPHFSGVFNIRRRVFNKTLLFRYLSKKASFFRVLHFFTAFLSATVFRGGQVRNLGENVLLTSQCSEKKKLCCVCFLPPVYFDKAY